MKILVTGSSGFVGEVLIPKLKDAGHEIIGVDWKSGKFTDIIKDISIPFEIKEEIDVIIHLAARLEHDRCTHSEYVAGNVSGTKSILEIAKQKKSFVVYVSTTAIYGDPQSPISEKTSINPNGDYALTKFQGEELCNEYKNEGLKFAIVRPSVLIGRKRLGIYKIIFKNLFQNNKIPILGNGMNKISFAHIDDFTDFLFELAEKKIDGLVVNFGGIVPGNLNEVVNELKKYTASQSKILHVPLGFIPILKILAKIKFIPVTPWQISVMHKDYFYDNEVLFSTGFKYKFKPFDAIKDMADHFKETKLK